MNLHRLIVCVLIATLILTTFGIAMAQDPEIQFSGLPSERYRVSEIMWKGHFGGRKEEPHNIYCLMTQGALRAPTSDDYEKLIETWLGQHPNAEARVVYVLSPSLTDFPDSKMKSVWVVDGEDILNIYLVRKGGCPAGTMLLNRGDKTSLAREEYESFSKRVNEAEQLAKKEKLGIWSERSASLSTC